MSENNLICHVELVETDFDRLSLTKVLKIQVSKRIMNSNHLSVLKNLMKTGGTGNVMEFLNYGNDHFQKGFNVANDMQNLNFVKLLYSNFNKNQVIVEITLFGESESQKN
jgi:hypothetical protein